MSKIKHLKIWINFLVISFFSLPLCSCNPYKKFFAGKGHEYNNVKSIKKLSIKNQNFSLHYNNRYVIPPINNLKEPIKITDLSPPNYVISE